MSEQLTKEVAGHSLVALLVTKASQEASDEYDDVTEMLRSRKSVLLLPVASSLVNLPITSKTFVETHVAIKNISNSAQFLSLNGTRSRRQGPLFQVLAGPPTADELDRFLVESDTVASTKSLYDTFEFIANATTPPFISVRVLAEDLVEIEGNLVHIMLLDEPIQFPGCPWSPVLSETNEKTRKQSSRTSSLQKLAADVLLMSPPALTSVTKPLEPEMANVASEQSPVSLVIQKEAVVALPSLSSSSSLSQQIQHQQQEQEQQHQTNAESPLSSDIVIVDAVPKTADQVRQAQRALLEKLADPRAASVVRAIRTFIDTFEKNLNVTPDHQGEQFQSFMQSTLHTIKHHVVWSKVNNAQLEGAIEALERYVTSKIYDIAFSPREDAERDALLLHRTQCLSFIQKEHFDINIPTDENDLSIAYIALRQLSSLKAPADKMAQIVNTCKIILRVLSIADGNRLAGADMFLPMLIYVIIKAAPPQLYSNLRYVQRYRTPEKLSSSEAAYYFTNFYSAVTFLENVDASSFTIDPELFQREYSAIERRLKKEGDHIEVFIVDDPLETATTRTNETGPPFTPRPLSLLVLSDPTPQTFLNATVDTIRVADIPLLIDEYKKIAEENAQLRKQLAQLGAI